MVGEFIEMIVVFRFRVVRVFLFIYCGEKSTLYKRLLLKACVTNGSRLQKYRVKS